MDQTDIKATVTYLLVANHLERMAADGLLTEQELEAAKRYAAEKYGQNVL